MESTRIKKKYFVSVTWGQWFEDQSVGETSVSPAQIPAEKEECFPVWHWEVSRDAKIAKITLKTINPMKNVRRSVFIIGTVYHKTFHFSKL
mgnify:CR=1 FL=1